MHSPCRPKCTRRSNSDLKFFYIYFHQFQFSSSFGNSDIYANKTRKSVIGQNSVESLVVTSRSAFLEWIPVIGFVSLPPALSSVSMAVHLGPGGEGPSGLTDLEALQLRANAITDDSLESTRRMVQMVEEVRGNTLSSSIVITNWRLLSLFFSSYLPFILFPCPF